MNTSPPTDQWRQERFQTGLDLLHDGQYWEAHESWEELWHSYPKESSARRATQALIQLAAICYKPTQAAAGRTPKGMQRGMRRLLATARGHIQAARELPPPSVDWDLQHLANTLEDMEKIRTAWAAGQKLSIVLKDTLRIAQRFDPLS